MEVERRKATRLTCRLVLRPQPKGRGEQTGPRSSPNNNHPPAMNHYELHSRISIDSEKDWDRIRANLTKTLLEQVDLRFADQPEADPKLKEEVIRRALEVGRFLFVSLVIADHEAPIYALVERPTACFGAAQPSTQRPAVRRVPRFARACVHSPHIHSSLLFPIADPIPPAHSNGRI